MQKKVLNKSSNDADMSFQMISQHKKHYNLRTNGQMITWQDSMALTSELPTSLMPNSRQGACLFYFLDLPCRFMGPPEYAMILDL